MVLWREREQRESIVRAEGKNWGEANLQFLRPRLITSQHMDYAQKRLFSLPSKRRKMCSTFASWQCVSTDGCGVGFYYGTVKARNRLVVK